MRPLLTRAQARAFDRHAIGQLGVPGLLLMENAGAGATRFLLERFRAAVSAPLIVGGVGQNGGDAWVVARHLLCAGYRARCWLIGDEAAVRGDARVNLDAYRALGGVIEVIAEPSQLASAVSTLRDSSVVVDGLFGTGLSRPIEGLEAALIAELNAAARPCLALDLPSGIDADSGQVLGVAVRAHATATFAGVKRGLAQHPGAAHAGELRVVSIGVPESGLGDIACRQFSVDDVATVLQPRLPDAHKGTSGHVLVVAGSAGKTGAALLVGHGALRSGAGLVTLAARSAAQPALDQRVTELMTVAFETSRDLLDYAVGKQGAALGPGLGLDEQARSLARDLACNLPLPTVVDADALTALGTDVGILRTAPAPRVLTPHPREASRLLGATTQEVQRDRFAAASALAEASGAVVVLKGARTVVASPEGRLWVSSDDVPALATAGSGDVLAGMIAANFATLEPLDAAWVGVALHAAAGKRAARADRGLLASEIAMAIPEAVSACMQPPPDPY